jgi:hypothetical protein
MELSNAELFDSFWLSDNQGPLGGIDIVKNTLKRMPSSMIEKWNVQQYAESFPRYGSKEKVGVMFNCNDGTWTDIAYLKDSFNEQFLIGGPVGFSCDIASFPEEYKQRIECGTSSCTSAQDDQGYLTRDRHRNRRLRMLAGTEGGTNGAYPHSITRVERGAGVMHAAAGA